MPAPSYHEVEAVWPSVLRLAPADGLQLGMKVAVASMLTEDLFPNPSRPTQIHIGLSL